MKKYLLKRILFSIFALFSVVGIVMVLVYSLIDRSLIFANDPTIAKKANNELEIYKIQKYEKYGYLKYYNYDTYIASKYQAKYGDEYTTNAEYVAASKAISNEQTYLSNPDVQEFIKTYEADRFTIQLLPQKKKSNGAFLSKAYLIATKDINPITRLFKYFGEMFKFETIHDVEDPNLTDRYVRWEWDKRSNMPALVGSGTTHKYLIYFDNKFPFVHQNILKINLGKSYVTYRDVDLTEVFAQATGEALFEQQEYPNDLGTGVTHETSYDFHTVTYNSAELSPIEISMFPDRYTLPTQQHSGLSRMANSFSIGIISTILVYLFGLPLGVLMALRKDKLADKLGNFYIIFIIAVPSLAYIFMFASIGMNIFGLPYKFATAEVKFMAYILPTISLALPAIGGLMKWMRRYMIDQMNSDYVKFARSQGLSEGEIFSKHVSPNAFIYLVHGIPADILGALTGAIITERVYGVPGVGALLTDAITKSDNSLIVAMTLFYTTLTIISLIAGDLLLAKYDPRISFTQGGN
ncbi:MAG: ABC transporter permease [Bacilli bacterium]|nr:ABC transporter permease [Bacilli bacterium]